MPAGVAKNSNKNIHGAPIEPQEPCPPVAPSAAGRTVTTLWQERGVGDSHGAAPKSRFQRLKKVPGEGGAGVGCMLRWSCTRRGWSWRWVGVSLWELRRIHRGFRAAGWQVWPFWKLTLAAVWQDRQIRPGATTVIQTYRSQGMSLSHYYSCEYRSPPSPRRMGSCGEHPPRDR